MADSKRLGIFCVETADWYDEESHLSMRSVFGLLYDLYQIPYIHRDVATKAELVHYLERWIYQTGDNGNPTYPFLYVGFHGAAGEINLSDGTTISMDDMLASLKGKCDRRIIHFASCSTLATSSEEINNFLHVTGASAVSGYSKDVDWKESIPFEFMHLASFNYDVDNHLSPKMVNQIWSRKNPKAYDEFVDTLGFEMHVSE